MGHVAVKSCIGRHEVRTPSDLMHLEGMVRFQDGQMGVRMLLT